jgi:hypothetical protein
LDRYLERIKNMPNREYSDDDLQIVEIKDGTEIITLPSGPKGTLTLAMLGMARKD